MTDTAERTQYIGPEPAIALTGLLDVPLPDLESGQPLPLAWHWIYLLDRVPQADIGPDGHALRGTIPAPPGPGRRRMWAGGTITQHAGGLICGEAATRRSRVFSTEEKTGRSGSLTFLTVEHLIAQRDQLVIEEHQQIVYRDAALASEAGSENAEQPRLPPRDGEWALEINPVLLFRFSALTYNAHRIHYDRDYALNEEGYPGLVTHGPLQAIAMAEAARALDLQGGRSAARTSFVFRMTAPLYDFQGLIAHARDDGSRHTTQVRDIYGRETSRGVIA